MARLDSRVCMVGLVCPEETKYGAVDSPGGGGGGRGTTILADC